MRKDNQRGKLMNRFMKPSLKHPAGCSRAPRYALHDIVVTPVEVQRLNRLRRMAGHHTPCLSGPCEAPICECDADDSTCELVHSWTVLLVELPGDSAQPFNMATALMALLLASKGVSKTAPCVKCSRPARLALTIGEVAQQNAYVATAHDNEPDQRFWLHDVGAFAIYLPRRHVRYGHNALEPV